MRKIFENAFTIGLVMSLANPHKAKQNVTRMNGIRKLIPSFEINDLFSSISVNRKL